MVEIAESAWWMFDRLQTALIDLASGVTRGFVLIEVDGTRQLRQMTASVDGTGLDDVADALLQKSAEVRRIASLWEGNAPPAHRSFSRH